MSPAAAAKAAKYGEFSLWPRPPQQACTPIAMTHTCPAHGTPEGRVQNVSSTTLVSVLTPCVLSPGAAGLGGVLGARPFPGGGMANPDVVLRSAWLWGTNKGVLEAEST